MLAQAAHIVDRVRIAVYLDDVSFIGHSHDDYSPSAPSVLLQFQMIVILLDQPLMALLIVYHYTQVNQLQHIIGRWTWACLVRRPA
jgi:hypothetical protein